MNNLIIRYDMLPKGFLEYLEHEGIETTNIKTDVAIRMEGDFTPTDLIQMGIEFQKNVQSKIDNTPEEMWLPTKCIGDFKKAIQLTTEETMISSDSLKIQESENNLTKIEILPTNYMWFFNMAARFGRLSAIRDINSNN